MRRPRSNAGLSEIDLTGVWDGLYSYTRSGELESTFTAVLFQTGGRLSGAIHETMRRRRGDVPANADVEGSVSGTVVSFAKHYDGTGGQQHTVMYEGRLSGDEIEGIWSIPSAPGNEGRFLMIRGRKAETRLKKEILEKI